MAQPMDCDTGHPSGIEKLLSEAQHRWLRPLEICEILQNYKRFNIAPEPPSLPPSGSIFLFNRKVLRYFRKDGHNWRKKKDGKTVKEAHEKLKAGSVDVLHCYYAHGEDNENFQRRSYWMLDENLSHIVLVHYLEVKGYKTNLNRLKEDEEDIPNGPEIEQKVRNSGLGNSTNSSLQQNRNLTTSQNTDSRSLNSAQSSDSEDDESDNYQGKSSTALPMDTNDDSSLGKHQKELDYCGSEHTLGSHDARLHSESVKPSVCSMQPDSLAIIAKQGRELEKQLLTSTFYERRAFGSDIQGPQEGQTTYSMDYDKDGGLQRNDSFSRWMSKELEDHDHLVQPSSAPCEEDKSDTESNLTSEKRSNQFSTAKCLSDSSYKDKGLKRSDSFDRWMSKELEDVERVELGVGGKVVHPPLVPSKDVEPVAQSSSGAYWDGVDNGSDCPSLPSQPELDQYTLGPSLSQDQLFRIIDISPNWGYTGSETKVLITGKFLKAQQDIGKCQWSCMFGEVEVPAEVIADGVLRCHTPLHGVGRVPFYVTRSNRLACSEVREFEYRNELIHGLDVTSLGHEYDVLQIRFGKLLSLGSNCLQNSTPQSSGISSRLCSEITSLLKANYDDWFQILKLTSKEKFSLAELKERLAERLLKEKLCEWLVYKAAEGENGFRVLDKDGQGVLHLAAALGYDWAIAPAVAAGLNINFRDVHGWTALHWAASYGRERTVVYLVSLGASAGALTDPTPTYPMGKTAADLASDNGHKGIAGYLAESALTAHLASLTLKKKREESHATEPSGKIQLTPILTASERIAIPISDGGHSGGLSLKDSLAAVCNATQAAARIHQVYRVRSFQRKKKKKLDENLGISDEHALSMVTMRSHKKGHYDEPVHAAAVRIQNKFRSWKGRKDFLSIRRHIVKIQAHVRGHQARKHYKKFVWSVGILEKVILRWRRKRSGLRGFRPEALTVKTSSYGTSSKEDDYDFLKDGRKQAEERLQKALSRVKSMVQYPEARDQYRRLLTAVSEIKEMKGEWSGVIDGSEAAASTDDMINAALLNYESFLPKDCSGPSAM